MSKVRLLAGEAQNRESSKAKQACNDYLRMGPNRSLRSLIRSYRDSEEKLAPTLSEGTLNNWSARYGWVKRAELYDSRLEEEKDARANEIMNTGLALAHERVQSLKDLARLLFEQLYEKGEDDVLHNLWMPDVKQIGGGEYAERVDIERYNSPLISDIRGVLDDLAKETGGRVHKTDVTSGGKPIPIREVIVELPKVEDE